MTIEISSFHASRLMWGIWNNTLMVAPDGYTLSHEEWFADFNPSAMEDFMQSCPRGFIKEQAIYTYQGRNFQSLSDKALKEFLIFLKPLKNLGNLAPDAPIYSGMIPGKPGEIWQPRLTLEF